MLFLKKKNNGKLSEKDIMKGIITYLNANGFLVKRLPPSIYSSKGMPDLYFLKKGISGFIEVKSDKGKQSPSQLEFETQINMNGGIYILATSIEDVKRKLKKIKTSEGKEIIR